MKKVEESENGERKRLCTSESKENDLEEVVIYTKEIKEKKERKVKKTYLV